MGTDEQDALIDIPPTVSAGANVVGMHNYLAMWEKSVNDPQSYWMEQVPPPPRKPIHTACAAADLAAPLRTAVTPACIACDSRVPRPTAHPTALRALRRPHEAAALTRSLTLTLSRSRTLTRSRTRTLTTTTATAAARPSSAWTGSCLRRRRCAAASRPATWRG